LALPLAVFPNSHHGPLTPTDIIQSAPQSILQHQLENQVNALTDANSILRAQLDAALGARGHSTSYGVSRSREDNFSRSGEDDISRLGEVLLAVRTDLRSVVATLDDLGLQSGSSTSRQSAAQTFAHDSHGRPGPQHRSAIPFANHFSASEPCSPSHFQDSTQHSSPPAGANVHGFAVGAITHAITASRGSMDIPSSAASDNVVQQSLDASREFAIGDAPLTTSAVHSSTFPEPTSMHAPPLPPEEKEAQLRKFVWDGSKCCWGVVDCGEDDKGPADVGSPNVRWLILMGDLVCMRRRH